MKSSPLRDPPTLIELLLFILLSMATGLASVVVLTFSATLSSGSLIAFGALITVGVMFFVLSVIYAYEAYRMMR
jgi:hypothetical protein